MAVGAVFVPRQKEAAAARSRHLLVTSLALHGLVLAEWRDVPIDENALGEKAKDCRPDIFYVIVTHDYDMNGDEFERRLIAVRKETEQRATAYHLDDFYIASLTIALHAEMTGSAHAEALLTNWSTTRRNFRRISPGGQPVAEQLPEIAVRQIARARIVR